MNQIKLTLEKYQSELTRLQMQYNKFDDKTCDKAQGVSEHIDAIRSII
jgi:hypothetical protein